MDWLRTIGPLRNLVEENKLDEGRVPDRVGHYAHFDIPGSVKSLSYAIDGMALRFVGHSSIHSQVRDDDLKPKAKEIEEEIEEEEQPAEEDKKARMCHIDTDLEITTDETKPDVVVRFGCDGTLICFVSFFRYVCCTLC